MKHLFYLCLMGLMLVFSGSVFAATCYDPNSGAYFYCPGDYEPQPQVTVGFGFPFFGVYDDSGYYGGGYYGGGGGGWGYRGHGGWGHGGGGWGHGGGRGGGGHHR